MQKLISVLGKAGIRTALKDGSLVENSPFHMATELLYKASAGSKIVLADKRYLFAVAEFEPKVEPEYIYRYTYQKEGNWTLYMQNLTPDSYGRNEYKFTGNVYFRICIKRLDGGEIKDDEAWNINNIIRYYYEEPEAEESNIFSNEIARVTNAVKSMEHLSATKLALLADSHFTFNGTWDDTAMSLKKVSKNIPLDAIVHLGDLTDGVLSKTATAAIAGQMINDMEQCGCPVYISLGNHDYNYFNGNTEVFSAAEMNKLYKVKSLEREKNYYYIDMEERKLRLIFLTSFDLNFPERYGFSEEEILWFENILYEGTEGKKVIIFSHVAPLAELDYWSSIIKNGEKAVQIAEKYNADERHHILGWFYGHTHADQECYGCSFPLISLCCNKCEYFLDKKPRNSFARERKLGTVAQDCWDFMLIDNNENKINLIRFGAGKDRIINCEKRKSVWSEEKKESRANRKIQIWAHRGVNKLAPENTLPAFELAEEMDLDGIELDVQLSKDGHIVVIHDETINRTGNGSGYVKDYTLEQLRQFNFNKKHTAFGHVLIPTLEEVYDRMTDTRLILNVELKNDKIEYEQLEDKVIALTREKNLMKRVIFSSFNHFSMIKLKRLAPEAKISFLYTSGFINMPEYAARYGAYALHPNVKGARELSAGNNEIKINIWDCNDMESINKITAYRVNAVITDCPDKILKEL